MHLIRERVPRKRTRQHARESSGYSWRVFRDVPSFVRLGRSFDFSTSATFIRTRVYAASNDPRVHTPVPCIRRLQRCLTCRAVSYALLPSHRINRHSHRTMRVRALSLRTSRLCEPSNGSHFEFSLAR